MQTPLDGGTGTAPGADALPRAVKAGEGITGGPQSRRRGVVVEVGAAGQPTRQLPGSAGVLDPGRARARGEDLRHEGEASPASGRHQGMQPGEALRGGAVGRPGTEAGKTEWPLAAPQPGAAEAATVAERL